MTVITRSKLSGGGLRRRRDGATARAATYGALPSADSTRPARPSGSSAARRRREAGAPQDQAMYSCECGFMFEAQVSTSVDCPHCGNQQAW